MEFLKPTILKKKKVQIKSPSKMFCVLEEPLKTVQYFCQALGGVVR